MPVHHPLSEASLLGRIREKDVGLYRLSTFDHSLSMDMLVNSKLTRDRQKRIGLRTALMDNPFVQKRAAQPFKRYEGAPRYALDDYKDVEVATPLQAIAKTRKSTKDYSSTPLSLMHLAQLFHYSYGVMRTELLHQEKVPWKFRPTPSPGGLFASEIYFLALNTDLPPGLYHYRPDTNVLEQVKLGDFGDFVRQYCGVEPYINSVATLGGVVMVTSLIERLYIKYGERSYKFMLIETGLLAGQLSNMAEALDIGSCMLGGYLDDEVNAFLGVDGVFETVQNVMVVGHRNA